MPRFFACARLLLPVVAGWVLLQPGFRTHAAGSADPVAPDRIEQLSRRYLGTPYKLDCLGEARGPDKDPLFTRKYVDCQTLVEQVMAEAIAPAAGGLDAAVRRIRYRGGQVSLENRYHYCIPDWLENPWPARDVTAAVAGESSARRKTLQTAQRRIDRPTFLASRGGNPGRSPLPLESVRTGYIPRSRIASVASRIPSGTIGVFVINKPGIVAGHVGFLFRQGNRVIFRHASQTRKRVVDELLPAYVQRAPRTVIGLKVLQPDMNGLKR
jgi:N-acetylmuramoyl-L-alanine amidase-like protein